MPRIVRYQKKWTGEMRKQRTVLRFPGVVLVWFKGEKRKPKKYRKKGTKTMMSDSKTDENVNRSLMKNSLIVGTDCDVPVLVTESLREDGVTDRTESRRAASAPRMTTWEEAKSGGLRGQDPCG